MKQFVNEYDEDIAKARKYDQRYCCAQVVKE